MIPIGLPMNPDSYRDDATMTHRDLLLVSKSSLKKAPQLAWKWLQINVSCQNQLTLARPEL